MVTAHWDLPGHLRGHCTDSWFRMARGGGGGKELEEGGRGKGLKEGGGKGMEEGGGGITHSEPDAG